MFSERVSKPCSAHIPSTPKKAPLEQPLVQAQQEPQDMEMPTYVPLPADFFQNHPLRQGPQTNSIQAKLSPISLPNPVKAGLESSDDSMIQMKYAVTADRDEFESGTYVGCDRNWMAILERFYEFLDDLRKVTDDDDDLEWLKAREAEIDKIAEILDGLTLEEEDAPEYLEERSRRSSLTLNPVRYGPTNKRKNVEPLTLPTDSIKDKKTPTKYEFAQEIHREGVTLKVAIAAIKAVMNLNEGGFSAKGRAHAMGESDTNSMVGAKDTTWFEGITLDGAKLSRTKKVYKATKKKPEAASDPVNQGFVEDTGLSKRQRKDKLTELNRSLRALDPNPPTCKWPRPPASKDRNGGQMQNMANTNASAYAMLAGISGWEGSKWEWLHVRAASLGGETDGTNLVVGTRDTNTQMMPIESHLRTLANIVKDNNSVYKELEVTFSITGQDSDAPHKVGAINIKWKLIKRSSAAATVKDGSGEAKFNPLETDASISKTDVAVLEEALKDHRDKVKKSAE
ncbi:hypothetical protein [Anthocerotibacter panamensis]|uniref:hypothetical protein n=1 Tax=Anthocerotibacter panamensis TaxID=2857077 RepID=UPI001C405C1A|nr:hypothetical protein [Anthocerotibacter panamensis]